MSPPLYLELILTLERLAFRGWPALESRDIAGWHLRFSGGYTKRANSINALGRDAQVDPVTLDTIEAVYRGRGLTPIWRLTPLAPPSVAGLLRVRGYRQIEHSLVQRCALGRFIADPAVAVHAQPSSLWIDAFCRYSPVAPAHRDMMQRMPRAIAPPVGFALVEQSSRPLALAIGAVEGDHMGLFDVLVTPEARRQGWARRVTESLYAWAQAQGARFAYLQVVATNAAALPLYEAQGFRTVYGYEYWVPPAP